MEVAFCGYAMVAFSENESFARRVVANDGNIRSHHRLLPPLLLWIAILSDSIISRSNRDLTGFWVRSIPMVTPQGHVRTSRILP
jgi:hypothetical protein